MRYSTAPAMLVASWLAKGVDAFVVAPPSHHGAHWRATRQNQQQQLSVTAVRGSSVGVGLARVVPRLKRRMCAAMNTNDGARWAPIPNVPNMKVSFVEDLCAAGSLALYMAWLMCVLYRSFDDYCCCECVSCLVGCVIAPQGCALRVTRRKGVEPTRPLPLMVDGRLYCGVHDLLPVCTAVSHLETGTQRVGKRSAACMYGISVKGDCC